MFSIRTTASDRLVFYTIGDRSCPAVVLLHGYTGSSIAGWWDRQVPPLPPPKSPSACLCALRIRDSGSARPALSALDASRPSPPLSPGVIVYGLQVPQQLTAAGYYAIGLDLRHTTPSAWTSGLHAGAAQGPSLPGLACRNSLCPPCPCAQARLSDLTPRETRVSPFLRSSCGSIIRRPRSYDQLGSY